MSKSSPEDISSLHEILVVSAMFEFEDVDTPVA